MIAFAAKAGSTASDGDAKKQPVCHRLSRTSADAGDLRKA